MKEWIPEGGFYNIKLREILVDKSKSHSYARSCNDHNLCPTIFKDGIKNFAGLRPFEACLKFLM